MRVNSQIEVPARSSSGAKWQRHRIADFSGGMVTSVPENSLRPNQFKRLSNLLFNVDGTLRARDDFRPHPINADYSTTYNPKDFWIGTLGGTEMLLVAQDNTTNLQIQKAGASAWDAAFGTLTKDSRLRFVKYAIGEAEDLIVCTGKDTPARCSGTALTSLGLTPPTAADFSTTPLELSTDSNTRGIQESGTYYYKFTFHYDTASSTKFGESTPSAVVTAAVALTAADNVFQVTINFTGETTPLPSGGHIKAYRSRAGSAGGPYYYVGQLTTSFVDNVPVGAEGDPLPPENGSVPKLEIPFVADGRLIGSDGDRPNKLVWSDQGAPDIFPALNFAYFKDNITGIAIFNRDTFVFTENEVYIVPESNFDNGPVKICDKGCASGETITDVGNGLVWMGKDSVYWANFNVRYADGDFPIPIGRPIENLVKEIAATYRKHARACYYNKDYYLSIPHKGGAFNTITLAMNVDIATALALNGSYGGWAQVNWGAESMMEYAGKLYRADRSEKMIYSHAKRAGVDYLTYADYNGNTGDGIEIIIESGDLYAEEISSDKLTRSFGIIASASQLSLTAQMAANYDAYSRSVSFSESGVVPVDSSAWMIWSSTETTAGKWYWETRVGDETFEAGDSVATWAGSTSNQVDAHKKFPAVKGKNLRYKITSSNALDLNILGFYWTFKELPARI